MPGGDCHQWKPLRPNSLLIDRQHGLEAAKLLRDDLELDFCSNISAVDWPDREKTEKVKVKQVVEGVEKEIEETRRPPSPAIWKWSITSFP